jgi:hypothetical protein
MASLIASSTGQADSADFTVVAGTPNTLSLTAAISQALPQDAWAEIKIKSSGGAYQVVGRLTFREPAQVLDGPGTFLVTKGPSSTAFGVDKD